LADAPLAGTLAGTAATRRLLLGNRSNAEQCRSRVVHLALPNLLSEPRERDLRASPKRRPRNSSHVFSLRVPNTPCEVGIHKTVEFLTELHETDSIFPGHVLNSHRRGASQTGHAERLVRLTAGLLRRRHREKQTENRLITLRTLRATTLFFDPFAPALTYKEKPLY
jgi:hypothetical protein